MGRDGGWSTDIEEETYKFILFWFLSFSLSMYIHTISIIFHKCDTFIKNIFKKSTPLLEGVSNYKESSQLIDQFEENGYINF